MPGVPSPVERQRARSAGVAVEFRNRRPRTRQHHAGARALAGPRAARESDANASVVDFLRVLVGFGGGERAPGLANLSVDRRPRGVAQDHLGGGLRALVAVAGRRCGGIGRLEPAAYREPGWLYNSAPLRNGQPGRRAPNYTDR